MAEPFLGEIRVFSFGIVPKGWLSCYGQLLQINSNQPLYALLGTQFGGNGVNTFGLPDLRGRFVVGSGAGTAGVGQLAGEASHTLLTTEMPAHLHSMQGSTTVAVNGSAVNAWPATSLAQIYSATANTTLGPGSSPSGASQVHSNQSPYTALNYCIAITGIFPPRQ